MCVTRFFCHNSFVFTQKSSVIDMAKIQINSETILFFKIFSTKRTKENAA